MLVSSVSPVRQRPQSVVTAWLLLLLVYSCLVRGHVDPLVQYKRTSLRQQQRWIMPGLVSPTSNSLLPVFVGAV
jgi:hypothetical protein